MSNSNAGRPPGYTALTPYLVVDGADAAIAFYQQVFGATLVNRLDGVTPDGTPYVGQAELDFGGSGRLQLSDPQPGFGLVAPDPAAEGVSQSIVVYVDDVDAVVARALERGAEVKEQPSDFVSGDRFAAFVDPFGRRWSVMTRDPAVSPEESWRRVEDWWRSMIGGTVS
ncbi:VOC family protein [Gryllotalpicola ginsengisoli]|uniref:VOC family protein n=1 Tax=Gryllotalpicola ginsengisoli TaxID=444608 RepID=UPI0003B3D03F|nr:VOC family protein [Gryllotalpicola ginsengisoli]